MTDQARKEKQQVFVTQEDIRVIKNEVEMIASKLAVVHDALVGNPIGQDGGLVRRVFDVEEAFANYRGKVDAILIVYKQNRFYLKALYLLAGGFIMTLASLIFTHIFKK